MIKTHTDLAIAEFLSLQKVDLSEVAHADIVIIKNQNPGGIYHPEGCRWWSDISDIKNPLEMIRSARERKSYSKTKKWFEDEGYEIKTIEMNMHLFEQFTELYENTTLNTQRPLYIDLTLISGRIKSDNSTFVTGLFKNDRLIAGLVFYIKLDQISVHLGAKPKFPEFRGGVGGVLEVELISFAQKLGISIIIHGRSVNPAGLVGKSGIFEFKARYGFSAFPEGIWQTLYFRNIEKSLSDLVFVSVVDNTIGYLIISDGVKEEVAKKYTTLAIEHITVISFAEAKEKYAWHDSYAHTI